MLPIDVIKSQPPEAVLKCLRQRQACGTTYLPSLRSNVKTVGLEPGHSAAPTLFIGLIYTAVDLSTD